MPRRQPGGVAPQVVSRVELVEPTTVGVFVLRPARPVGLDRRFFLEPGERVGHAHVPRSNGRASGRTLGAVGLVELDAHAGGAGDGVGEHRAQEHVRLSGADDIRAHPELAENVHAVAERERHSLLDRFGRRERSSAR